jgi:hypothetical protein
MKYSSIKVKFQKDDPVYFMRNDKIEHGVVYSGYTMWTNSLDNPLTHYYIIVNSRIEDSPIKEEVLFASEEELKNNL